MKKDDGFTFTGISPEVMLMLREIQKQRESGEELDSQTIEALKAIDIASKVVNTIMSGNQIDPVFFKHLSDLTQEKMKNFSDEEPKKRIVKKKRKLKLKKGPKAR